jgi:hypothetical protein
MRKRKSHPYLMRGAPKVTEERATVLDPPDKRVPFVPVRTLTPEQLAERRVAATDPRLRAVDRCFERWAATPSQTSEPRLSHLILINRQGEGGPVPLDDLESKIVDTVVRTSPKWARNFVHLWYRTGHSVTDIARLLAIKRREYVYAERQVVLGYYLGRLSEAASQLDLKG